MTKQPTSPEETEVYLGDAVYASFDGHMIKLRTGDGNNQIIYLEGSVYQALVDWVNSLCEAKVEQELETGG